MQATIKFIREELLNSYPETEVQGFIRLIMENVCNLSFTNLSLKNYRLITVEELGKIEKIVERLKKEEPIQYIIGETEFFGYKFTVSNSVLIPRQETEELVNWILKSNIKKGSKVLDIGTGSGCIPISLKKERADFNVSAIDISKNAVNIAIQNARNNQVEIEFLVVDILSCKLINSVKYDVIVSNPPYVRKNEKMFMKSNVLDFEPETALFVPDSDPLKFYKKISAFASMNLNPGGFLFFEINEAFGVEISELLEKEFCNIELRKDLNGKNRMIKALKKQK